MTSLPHPALFRLRSHHWLLVLWELSVLNVVFRLSSGNYYSFGCWAALSLAFGLSWLAHRYQRPALRYCAAGGVAVALILLGLEIRADRAASPARHQPPAAMK